MINHIARDYIPVVASVGADREGNSYNINADEAAAAIAVALHARAAVFLTDVRGWLRDPADPESLIAQASVEQVRHALDGDRRRHAAEARRRASTPSRAASARPRSSTGASRTRCCSSSSPTPASAPR